MDKRILQKVQDIKLAEQSKIEEAKQHKIEQEKRLKSYIQEKIPAAREWVETVLLEKIANLIAKSNSSNEINLNYCDFGSGYIPIEAKVIAVKEIEGLYIREQWVQKSRNPNDESGMTWDEAHYEYYVGWII